MSIIDPEGEVYVNLFVPFDQEVEVTYNCEKPISGGACNTDPLDNDVSLIDASGSIIFSKANGASTEHLFLSAGNYQLKARKGVCGKPRIRASLAGTWHFESRDKFCGGARISKIEKFNTHNESIKCTNLVYDENTRSSGSIINYGVYISNELLPQWIDTTSGFNLTKLTSGLYYSYLVRHSESIAEIGRTQGNNVGYSKVTVFERGNGFEEMYYSSPYSDPDLNMNHFQDPYAPVECHEDLRGLLIAHNTYDNIGRLVETESNSFNKDILISQYGFHLKEERTGNTDPQNCPTYSPWSFTYKFLTYPFFWPYLSQTETSHFDLNGNPTYNQVISYEYNNPSHAQVTKISTTNSNGDISKSIFKYPKDYEISGTPTNSNTIALSKMANSDDLNIQAVPIEKVNFIEHPDGNIQVVNASLNTYKFENTHLLPDKEFSLNFNIAKDINWYNGNGPHVLNNGSTSTFVYPLEYEQEVNYLEFDDKGNLLNYQVLNGPINSVEWNQSGERPNAKFANASYRQNQIGKECSFNGFEDGINNDGWTDANCILDNTTSHTGEWSELIPRSATFGATKDFLPENQHQQYRLSCWVKFNSSYSKGAGGNGFLVIQSKHNNSNNAVYPNLAHAQITVPVDGIPDEWNYIQAVIDLGELRDATGVSQDLRLRCYLENFDANNLYVDDIRFEPVTSNTVSLTYDPLYKDQISSKSDQRNTPSFYYYDGFGRLKWTLDQRKNVIDKFENIYYDSNNLLSNNYTQNTKFRNPFTIDQVNSGVPVQEERISTIQYFDGLGRLTQGISKAGSPQGFDVIQPVKYDQYGRESIKYLPYVSGNSDGKYDVDFEVNQHAFFNSPASYTIANDQFPTADQVYDNSPLNRVSKQGSVGQSFQTNMDRCLKFDYSTNNLDDAVWQWTVNVNSSPYLPTGAHKIQNYPENSLVKTIVIDENGSTSVEFKDFFGHLICKRNMVECILDNGEYVTYDYTEGHANPRINGTEIKKLDTYYIYDDYGNLIYIITPKGSEVINSTALNSFDESSQIFIDQIYAYHYDGRNRMIEKKIPGKEWEYYVYNTLNQLVMSQDGFLRGSIGNFDLGWKVFKYDALGRPVLNGLTTFLNPGEDRIGFQNEVNSNFYQYESRIRNQNQTNLLGYSDLTIPTMTNQIYVVKYYDENDYENSILSTENSPYSRPSAATNSTAGMLTGELNGVDEGNPDISTHTFSLTKYFYDERARQIEVQKKNHVSGWDKIVNTYNFSSQVVSSNRLHTSFSNPDLNLLTFMEYDHSGRILKIHKRINSDPDIIESFNEYNELGQLVRKNLHKDGTIWPGASTADYLQKIDYRYNIRGWLTSINNSDLIDDAGVTNTDNNDAFGENIYYEHLGNLSSGINDIVPIPQFNGNISEITWNTKPPYNTSFNLAFRPISAYIYRYDNLNRLTAGYFSQNSLPFPNLLNECAHCYDELFKYDLVGNISHLKRNYKSDLVDDLSYTYEGNSNQLDGILDHTIAPSPFGFNEAQHSNGDYAYDGNGNQISDNNKGLALVYNKWNLPFEVTDHSSDLVFNYDGIGTKLSKHLVGLGVDYYSYYSDGIEYKEDQLQFISTEEGRIRPVSSSTLNPGVNFVYDYFLKDHLGNIRAVVTNELRRDYYAATMEQQNSSAEEKLFYNIPATREDLPSGYPLDSTYTPNSKISNVNPDNGRPIGHAKVLKIAQGDNVSLDTKYYFNGAAFIPNNNRPIDDILTNLANIFFVNPNSPVSGKSSEDRLQWASNTFTNNPEIGGFLTDAFNQSDENDPDLPKAYLIYLFFNRDFKFVSEVSGLLKVSNPDQLGELGVLDLKIEENGYLYVYVTNESPKDVNFDNLRIIQYSNFLIEHNDYYPYGLLIDALSSFSNNGVAQNYKYNGKELQRELHWNVEDYGARQYDPVIGRWLQVDPLAHEMPSWSPFSTFFDNPIKYIDKDGRKPGDPPTGGDKTKINKTTTEKIINFGKEVITGTVDEVAFIASSVFSGVGNTVIGVSKKAERIGLVKALDEGGIDVLSKEERFSPIGFSFEEGFKKEAPNFSETVPLKDGKRIMKGIVTIISAGVPTTGVVESVIKTVVGVGVKKGIEALPDDKKNQQQNKSEK